MASFQYALKVADSSGNPLPNVNIDIYPHGAPQILGNIVASGITDAAGFVQPPAVLDIGSSYDFTTTSVLMPSGTFTAPNPVVGTFALVPGPPGAPGVGLNWTGAWSGATAYHVDDAVSLSGSSYVCILAHTNHTPPNATYWNVLAAAGAPGASTLAALTDVALSGLANGNILAYNSGTSKWDNVGPTLVADNDVLITAPANNDVLTYETSSTKWKNKPASGGGGSTRTHLTVTGTAGITKTVQSDGSYILNWVSGGTELEANESPITIAAPLQMFVLSSWVKVDTSVGNESPGVGVQNSTIGGYIWFLNNGQAVAYAYTGDAFTTGALTYRGPLYSAGLTDTAANRWSFIELCMVIVDSTHIMFILRAPGQIADRSFTDTSGPDWTAVTLLRVGLFANINGSDAHYAAPSVLAGDLYHYPGQIS